MNIINKNKKILYVITKSNFGGAQRYVYDLATHIPSDTFDVKVLLGGDGLLKSKLEKNGIPTILLSCFKRDINIFSDISLFFALIKIFKKEKPNIIHLNSSKAGFVGALAGRIAHVPKIIFTAHGWVFNEQRNFLLKFIFLKIHWLTILLSHKTIAVSQQTKKQVYTLPFVKNKIKVIYNGISDTILLHRNKARLKLFGKHSEEYDNSVWIGTISELHSNKGLEFAIKAISLLKNKYPNIIFLIIGDGEDREKLEKLITRLDLSKNVYFVGQKDNAATLLSAFDIFLLSSITEALPYVLLEAGHAKLPSVSTDVGGIREIIENNKSGLLVPPKNPEALSNALLNLIENPELRNIVRENLYKKVSQDFSLERMVKKTISIYE